MRKTGTSAIQGTSVVVGLMVVVCAFMTVGASIATAGMGALERPTDAAGASSIDELFEIQGDQFTLKGTHGYQITVVGYLAGRHTVTLYAKRPHSEVEYTAPGKVTEEGVSARFGSLGSVDVHFEASGRVREAIDYCDDSHPTVAVRLGTFVGTIDFRGERDYTSVSADRAQGGVGNDVALPGEPEDASCRSLAAGGEVVQKAQFTSLEAVAPGGGVYFDAIATTELEGEGTSSSGGSHVLFAAGSSDKEKRMEVRRLVGTEGPASDFSFDAGLGSATLTPPAPFGGTAHFREDADGRSSWTGSLKVPIPGLGTVRMAGPGSRARLERSIGTVIH